jgi:hypothetical protein
MRQKAIIAEHAGIERRAIEETISVTRIGCLAKALCIGFSLYLTAAGAPRNGPQDNRGDETVHSSPPPVDGIATPPHTLLTGIRRAKSGKVVDKVDQGNQPRWLLNQEHMNVRLKERSPLVVCLVEEPCVVVAKLSGERAHRPFTHLKREMNLRFSHIAPIEPGPFFSERHGQYP